MTDFHQGLLRKPLSAQAPFCSSRRCHECRRLSNGTLTLQYLSDPKLHPGSVVRISHLRLIELGNLQCQLQALKRLHVIILPHEHARLMIPRCRDALVRRFAW